MEQDHLEQDLLVGDCDLADKEDRIQIFCQELEIGLEDLEEDLVDEEDGEEEDELEDECEDEDDLVDEDELVDDGDLWTGLIQKAKALNLLLLINFDSRVNDLTLELILFGKFYKQWKKLLLLCDRNQMHLWLKMLQELHIF